MKWKPVVSGQVSGVRCQVSGVRGKWEVGSGKWNSKCNISKFYNWSNNKKTERRAS